MDRLIHGWISSKGFGLTRVRDIKILERIKKSSPSKALGTFSYKV